MLTRYLTTLLYTGMRFALLITIAMHGMAALADGQGSTNRLIIKFRTGPGEEPVQIMNAARVEQIRTRTGMELLPLRTITPACWVMQLPGWLPDEEVDSLAREIETDLDVIYAVTDRIKRPLLVPNDTLYDSQWSLFEDAGGARVQDAWDQERGSASVLIAQVDTGIQTHDDLDPARIAPGYDFISDPDIANDGDGRDPDPSDPGDAVAAGECGPNSPPEDSSWHGLRVAGIMVSTADNNAGVAGINHRSRLLMARALGKCGGYTSDIIDAMRWSAGLQVPGVPGNENPANVINLSFGGRGPCSAAEQEAINQIVSLGAVVIVAAGNNGGSALNSTPANCDNVITVAATTRSGSRASYTNTGSVVDLSAPGGDFQDGILTILNSGTTDPAGDIFGLIIGTSAAAAHVSGIASLMLSVNDQLAPHQIEEILQDTSRDFTDTSCNPDLCGSGIVDARAAVQAAADTSGETPGIIPPNDGGGGGGGGGCTTGLSASGEPLLILLLIGSLFGLCRKNRTGSTRGIRFRG